MSKNTSVVSATDAVVAPDMGLNHRKYARLASIAVLALTFTLSMGVSAFAAGDISAISAAIANGMSSFYGVLKAVTVPIAAVAAVAAVFQIFTGGEKGMEKAKKIIIYTAIGVAIAYIGPLLIKTVAGWFDTVGDGGAFTT